MATSSITANFEIRDPKAARAFVDGLWKAYRMKPPRLDDSRFAWLLSFESSNFRRYSSNHYDGFPVRAVRGPAK